MEPTDFSKILGCFGLPPGQFIYLSVPCTGGIRSIVYPRVGLSESQVRLDNLKEARAVATAIRENQDALVLNPLEFHMDAWKHADYMRLWVNLIEVMRPAIALTEDWAYSAGCIEEYFKAVDLGLTILLASKEDGELSYYSPDAARMALQTAIKEVRSIWGVNHLHSTKTVAFAFAFRHPSHVMVDVTDAGIDSKMCSNCSYAEYDDGSIRHPKLTVECGP